MRIRLMSLRDRWESDSDSRESPFFSRARAARAPRRPVPGPCEAGFYERTRTKNRMRTAATTAEANLHRRDTTATMTSSDAPELWCMLHSQTPHHPPLVLPALPPQVALLRVPRAGQVRQRRGDGHHQLVPRQGSLDGCCLPRRPLRCRGLQTHTHPETLVARV